MLFRSSRFALLPLAILLLAYAVGLEGTYYNHQFIFAAPALFALFVSSIETLSFMAPSPIKLSMLIVMSTLVACSALSLQPTPFPYEVRLRNVDTQNIRAQRTAYLIDSILDSCNQSSYLFLGKNGIQPFGFTKHSPLGPLFFQLDFFSTHPTLQWSSHMRHEIRKAGLIVINESDVGNENAALLYDELSFSTTPWTCVKNTARPPFPYKFFFRTSSIENSKVTR